MRCLKKVEHWVKRIWKRLTRRGGIYIQGNFFDGGVLESFRETAWLGLSNEVEEAEPGFNNGVGRAVICLASGLCAVQSSGGKATRQKRGAGWRNSMATSGLAASGVSI